jgi:hypothetical protein
MAWLLTLIGTVLEATAHLDCVSFAEKYEQTLQAL